MFTTLKGTRIFLNVSAHFKHVWNFWFFWYSLFHSFRTFSAIFGHFLIFVIFGIFMSYFYVFGHFEYFPHFWHIPLFLHIMTFMHISSIFGSLLAFLKIFIIWQFRHGFFGIFTISDILGSFGFKNGNFGHIFNVCRNLEYFRRF